MPKTPKELDEGYKVIIGSPFWQDLTTSELKEALRARRQELQRDNPN